MSYGQSLVIKGKNYTRSNLHSLLLEINGYSTTSKVDEESNIIGLFGELNTISSFHPTPFTIHGQNYHSTEQFIQQQKCQLFRDKGIEHLIMTSETALECKIVAKDVKNFDLERSKQPHVFLEYWPNLSKP